MCLELLGWAWNRIAQRTHCQLIFMFDSIWPGTFVSRILLAPGICPHNYVQYVVQRVIRMLCLELFGWASNCSAQRTHCELIFVFDNIQLPTASPPPCPFWVHLEWSIVPRHNWLLSNWLAPITWSLLWTLLYGNKNHQTIIATSSWILFTSTCVGACGCLLHWRLNCFLNCL